MSFARKLLLFGLALLAFAGRASADDRDLLRTTSGNPYLFIILDTSGSMNWTPPCTQAQFDAGQCNTLCIYRDCFTRLQADDPESKTYQAKEALYEVLQDVTNVQFGFATYNEDDLWVRAKHWIYKAGSGGVSLPGGTVSGVTYPAKTYPAQGADEVFGFSWACNTGSGDNQAGCAFGTPADLNNPWALARMQRWPKGGANFLTAVSYWVKWAGNTYKVTYTPAVGSLPGASTVTVAERVDKCPTSSCATNLTTQNVTFTLGTTNGLNDEFLSWDNGDSNGNNETITAADPTITYFTQGVASDSADTNTCGTTNQDKWGMVGWDSNNDTSADTHTSGLSYDLKWPTDTSDARGAAYYMGDMIPFDWKTDHKTDILKRLAPNLVTNPGATPDFRIATYFNNLPNAGENFLRLKNDLAKPLIPNGSTPIGNAMFAFKTWYDAGCPTCTPRVTSWRSTASGASGDPDWGCRRKFVLFITDGDETCGTNDPCTIASSLRANDGVLTYVIGLGLDSNVGNKLTCMASNGGTGAPIYPQNKQELVNALTTILGQIKEAASSFASAAVPTVQIEAADKIYISNFTPLNNVSVWNGHIDAYLKPLPLTAANLPDRNAACPLIGSPTTPRSACHLWDAATQLIGQAPQPSALASASTIDATALQLGLSFSSQRRLFYGKAAAGSTVPRALRLFYPPPSTAYTTDADWQDLFAGFFFAGTPLATAAASASRVTDIMKQTVVVKSSSIDNGTPVPTPVTYVLGDTFHADPVVIDKPNDFRRYIADVNGNGQTCGDNVSTGLPNNPGYKCWADKLQFRRKIVAVASDDGQVHFFDAGIYQSSNQKYDDGTGNELFAFMPRLALPIIRDLAEQGVHIFGPDSTPRVQDVFIDPSHNGTPVATDRQWRTVAFGGFREGGKKMGGGWISNFTSGYYALDITQPDTVDPTTHVPSTAQTPNCLTLGNTAVTVPNGCGPVPFPALLWEFTDSLNGSQLDEDRNGRPDLGQTWSIPTIGRIHVKNASNQVIDKWVAIFGGGLDADNKSTPANGSGTYIYIVDVETGLVIYKRAVTGAVPADPAVVDVNNDGVLDTIYVATTAGFVYKIDMSNPVQLQNVTIAANQALPNFATSQTVQRITDSTWNPVAIFDTGGKPIYYGVNALFISALNGYALAFGTGDRENLWFMDGTEGRFYLIVDQGFASAQTESQYTQITPSGSTTTNDLVSGPTAPPGLNRGWYIRLRTDERVITKAFGLSGLVVFSSYRPNATTPDANGLCGRTGSSYVYTLYLKNANPVLQDPVSKNLVRFEKIDIFVAPPTVDSGSTKNPNNPNQRSVATLTPEQISIMNNLKATFPKNARFGNFFYVINAMGSDTRFIGVAAVPNPIIVRNWQQVH